MAIKENITLTNIKGVEDKVIKEPENNEDLALMQAQDWDQQIREQIEAEVA